MYVPARFITVMSFSLALLCLLFLVVSLGCWFCLKAAPPAWMTEVGLLTLLGAMVLFALGIVSEYQLRILGEASKRPPFVVERVIERRDNQT
jgi:hypothetical protein